MIRPIIPAILMSALLAGCSDPKPKETPPVEDSGASKTAPSETKVVSEDVSKDVSKEDAEKLRKPSEITTQEQLVAAIREANPQFEGEVGARIEAPGIVGITMNDPTIEDIGPLAGLPLFWLELRGTQVRNLEPLRGMQLGFLYLEQTRVEKIDVLKGMPLAELYLDETQVEDIDPLVGSPLIKLNLQGTDVTDLRPLAKMRNLKMLWLNNTPVSDIGPLANVRSLESLTLAGTKVSDLSPLKGHPLQRLHIGRTPVKDLSALEWMRLTRLVFTPGRITQGIGAARNMSSIYEIGTQFGEPPAADDLASPRHFWPRYDAGEF